MGPKSPFKQQIFFSFLIGKTIKNKCIREKGTNPKEYRKYPLDIIHIFYMCKEMKHLIEIGL